MSTIEINAITKDYGGGHGVFDVTLAVEEGEVMGFLGPNGAGKTTTIRQLMGFIRPDKGSVRIRGLDCFDQAEQIERDLGYLPGEIAFLDDMSGMDFISFIAKMKGVHSMVRARQLMEQFELDARSRIKKMSKGTKQKIGIVCAFLQSPGLLILDEPSSGLDPLMQGRFIDLVLEEKQRGATILLSSHIFEEIERTCDRAAMIKQGHLIAVENVEALRRGRSREFIVRFGSAQEAQRFAAEQPRLTCDVKSDTATIKADDINAFVHALSRFTICDLDARGQSLEEIFLHFYGSRSMGENARKGTES